MLLGVLLLVIVLLLVLALAFVGVVLLLSIVMVLLVVLLVLMLRGYGCVDVGVVIIDHICCFVVGIVVGVVVVVAVAVVGVVGVQCDDVEVSMFDVDVCCCVSRHTTCVVYAIAVCYVVDTVVCTTAACFLFTPHSYAIAQASLHIFTT